MVLLILFNMETMIYDENISGYIETAMTAAIPDHIRQMTLMAIPMGQAGQPEDIAEVALFLASEKAKYITGAAIDVNGGLL